MSFRFIILLIALELVTTEHYALNMTAVKSFFTGPVKKTRAYDSFCRYIKGEYTLSYTLVHFVYDFCEDCIVLISKACKELVLRLLSVVIFLVRLIINILVFTLKFIALCIVSEIANRIILCLFYICAVSFMLQNKPMELFIKDGFQRFFKIIQKYFNNTYFNSTYFKGYI